MYCITFWNHHQYFQPQKVVNVKILIDGSYSAVDRIYNCCYKVMFDSFFFILVDRCENSLLILFAYSKKNTQLPDKAIDDAIA